jgi:predicted DCC family thiol-disulfide oxidoreductase YuxK
VIPILLPSDLKMERDKLILLFDGHCNLCNASVSFVLPRDKKDRFRFASLQSEAGKALLSRIGIRVAETDSLVLIEGDKVYLRSEAALRTAKNLGGIWSLAYGLMLVPAFIRDGVYNWIARNRYHWFGRKEMCRVPTEAEQKKFLL